MLVSRSSAFGGKSRTLVLLALGLLEESFPRELARILGVSLNGVQQALRRLEADGLIAGRLAGRMRLYRLDPRYFARQELSDYLRRLAEPENKLKERIEGLRKRPRRAGKPPARTEFRALAAKARAQARRAGLKSTDVQRAIRKVRRHG